MAKEKTFKVTVTVVPPSGQTTSQLVTVPATATLGEVLKAGGIDPEKKDFTVDGNPATLETKITSVSKVALTEVKVTERPRGS